MGLFRLAAKIAITSVVAAGAYSIIGTRLFPKPSNLMTGALHFRNAMQEFQKGCSAVVFGSTAGTAADAEKQREANRIPIE